MKLGKWLAGGLGLFLVAGVVGFTAVAFTSSASAQEPKPPGERHRERPGINAEALKEKRNQMIDAAVANGRLTREQADKLKEAGPGAFRHGMGADKHARPVMRVVHNILQAAAEVIDIDVVELRKGLREGKSLAAIASENGVSRGALISDLEKELKADIAQALANGRIDQPQADRLTQALSQHIEQAVDRTGGTPGKGLPGGGGHGPRGGGTPRGR